MKFLVILLSLLLLFLSCDLSEDVRSIKTTPELFEVEIYANGYYQVSVENFSINYSSQVAIIRMKDGRTRILPFYQITYISIPSSYYETYFSPQSQERF